MTPRSWIAVIAVVGAVAPGATPARATPSNDAFEDPQEVSVPSRVGGSTLGATTEDQEPRQCPMLATVWYRFSVPSPLPVTLRVRATSPGSTWALYARAGASGLRLVRCGGGTWPVGLFAEPGRTYLVQVGNELAETRGGPHEVSVGIGASGGFISGGFVYTDGEGVAAGGGVAVWVPLTFLAIPIVAGEAEASPSEDGVRACARVWTLFTDHGRCEEVRVPAPDPKEVPSPTSSRVSLSFRSDGWLVWMWSSAERRPGAAGVSERRQLCVHAERRTNPRPGRRVVDIEDGCSEVGPATDPATSRARLRATIPTTATHRAYHRAGGRWRLDARRVVRARTRVDLRFEGHEREPVASGCSLSLLPFGWGCGPYGSTAGFGGAASARGSIAFGGFGLAPRIPSLYEADLYVYAVL